MSAVSAAHLRRRRARAWARDAVGPLPAAAEDLEAGDLLVAYASHVVASACLKIRYEMGAAACRPLLESLILSAAHVAAGAAGESPASVLREMARGLDDEISPIVRERANA